MKLKYKANVGERINYRFMGFTTFEDGWRYNECLRQWEHNVEMGDYAYNSHQPYCKTMKSFKRNLKKAPKGVKFILVSRWAGHNIEGAGSNPSIVKTIS